MKFTTILAAFSLLIAPALGVQVTYDTTYDIGSQSLSTVACSDGVNGLLTKGYTTFSSLPTFPNIGGAQAVAGWNSPNCGTCWSLTWGGNNVTVLAVDHAGSGFNIGLQAMNTLTGGQAYDLGVVQATATQLANSACGMK
ncbi:hypothetical protein JAAARDRAFT_33287 [Jaapia argillacea MUCL 33604]|uniref:Cerato-platanin n=1 Tax=Jaapia argillacea MUCL 33604 TaxID=933084 RepID=A0A067QAV5_9AGAM|nr:hypothetical protein JAAARDRAFT_33287 [Jaapia argillacea MUCL 33604]